MLAFVQETQSKLEIDGRVSRIKPARIRKNRYAARPDLRLSERDKHDTCHAQRELPSTTQPMTGLRANKNCQPMKICGKRLRQRKTKPETHAIPRPGATASTSESPLSMGSKMLSARGQTICWR